MTTYRVGWQISVSGSWMIDESELEDLGVDVSDEDLVSDAIREIILEEWTYEYQDFDMDTVITKV